MPVTFFSEGIRFRLAHQKKIRSWIEQAILNEREQPGDLNIIFCSDVFLLDLNRRYLNHDLFTDILTFNTRDDTGFVSGDLYISIDRVKENSLTFKNPFRHELHRVIIHGILHLLGYSDKKKRQIAKMREKEAAYLSLLD